MNKRKIYLILGALALLVLFTGSGAAAGIADEGEPRSTILQADGELAGQPAIEIASANAKPGDVIQIPISVTEANGLAGYGFAIRYDNNALTPAPTVQAGTANGVGVPVYNPAYSSNKIFLTWADANVITSGGSLAVISFTVKKGAKSGSTLLSWDENSIYINDTNGQDISSTFAFTDGAIKISGGSSSGGGGGGGSAVSAAVTGVAVKNAPHKIVYSEGEALELSGLTVTLQYSDGSSKDVALAEFDKYDITVSPREGTLLNAADSQFIINVSTKNAIQKITVNKAAPPKPPLVKLSDIDGHWAKANIERLVAKGYIAGYEDSSFQPDAMITRAEFTTLIVKAFGLQADKEKVFSDTAGHWAQKYISAAAANGTVSGYNEQEFGPDEAITREQMAIMIINAAAAQPKAGELSYSDGDEISPWALNWVTAAVYSGLMSGYPDNTFRPAANATRAEAVTVIISALEANLI